MIEKSLSTNSKLIITENDNDVILSKIDNSDKIEILQYKDLNFTQMESLKKMIDQFNN